MHRMLCCSTFAFRKGCSQGGTSQVDSSASCHYGWLAGGSVAIALASAPAATTQCNVEKKCRVEELLVSFIWVSSLLDGVSSSS